MMSAAIGQRIKLRSDLSSYGRKAIFPGEAEKAEAVPWCVDWEIFCRVTNIYILLRAEQQDKL